MPLHSLPRFRSYLDISSVQRDFVFNEYYRNGMTAEAIDIASQMMSTSLIQFETFLYLPRKIDEAKDTFRRHLEIRRYVTRQTALDEPLSDDITNQNEFVNQQDSFGDADDSLEESRSRSWRYHRR